MLLNPYGAAATRQTGVANLMPERGDLTISVIVLATTDLATEMGNRLRHAHLSTQAIAEEHNVVVTYASNERIRVFEGLREVARSCR
jgi:hypothetical protein